MLWKNKFSQIPVEEGKWDWRTIQPSATKNKDTLSHRIMNKLDAIPMKTATFSC